MRVINCNEKEIIVDQIKKHMISKIMLFNYLSNPVNYLCSIELSILRCDHAFNQSMRQR